MAGKGTARMGRDPPSDFAEGRALQDLPPGIFPLFASDKRPKWLDVMNAIEAFQSASISHAPSIVKPREITGRLDRDPAVGHDLRPDRYRPGVGPTRLAFRAVHRHGAPGHVPGLQRHHLLPCQLLAQRWLGRMFDAVGGLTSVSTISAPTGCCSPT